MPWPSGVPSRLRSLWRLRGYVLAYRTPMLVMFAATVVAVAAGTVVPLVTKAVIDGPVSHGDRRGIVVMSGLALLLGLVEAGLAFVRRWIQSVTVVALEAKVRDDLYAHLQRLSVGFHDRWQSGQLLSRATTDLGTIRRFFGFGLVFLVVNAMQFLAVIALLLHLYLPLGALVAVTSVPVILLAHRFGASYSVLSRRVQDQRGDVATVVEEAATGIRVIKAFGRRRQMEERFGAAARTLRSSALDTVRLRGSFWAVLELVPNLTMAAVVLLGALAVGHGAMSVGSLVAFTSLLVLLQWPIIDLGWILSIAQEAATAADRIYEVFDTAPAIVERPHAVPLVHPQGRLAFEGVGFRYPGTRRSTPAVLQGVDLVVEPGETVAIVGATGSGKTTLAALVPRLYDVTTGRITLDGHDIRDLTLPSLRRAVSTAFEDPVLFSMSVRENITLGAPDASDDDVQAALSLAQADFVHDLPWGLDTRIGEQGLSLSGGQRQRLALARAVVHRPRVLVLDDPLSALDVHTEALVEDALRRVLRGTTALLVVHRPSTVALADRVALLDGGTIAAVGTHSELLASVPRYAAVLSADADEEVAS